MHKMKDIFQSPFFFQDRLHLFFVSSVESLVSVAEWADFGILFVTSKIEIVPPLLIKPDFPKPPGEVFFSHFEIEPGVADPSSVEAFLSRNPYINQAMSTGGTVLFGVI